MNSFINNKIQCDWCARWFVKAAMSFVEYEYGTAKLTGICEHCFPSPDLPDRGWIIDEYVDEYLRSNKDKYIAVYGDLEGFNN